MGWSDNGTLVVPRHERRGRARGHSPPPSPTGLECLPRPLTMPFKRVCFLNNVQEIITPVSNSQPKSIPVWPGSLGPGPLPFSVPPEPPDLGGQRPGGGSPGPEICPESSGSEARKACSCQGPAHLLGAVCCADRSPRAAAAWLAGLS